MFAFGKTSEAKLVGVHADLVRVVRCALSLSEVDFSVIEGLRSLDTQRKLVASGASQSLDGRHLTGHAVDLAPFVAGSIRWDWPPVFKIADAMLRAARMEGVPIRWGGAWDRDSTSPDMMAGADVLLEAYCQRQRARGRKPFTDGIHFELPVRFYPKGS